MIGLSSSPKKGKRTPAAIGDFRLFVDEGEGPVPADDPHRGPAQRSRPDNATQVAHDERHDAAWTRLHGRFIRDSVMPSELLIADPFVHDAGLEMDIMTVLVSVLVLALLFAVFGAIPREGRDRRCFMCPIRRALGGCGKCGASGPDGSAPDGRQDARKE